MRFSYSELHAVGLSKNCERICAYLPVLNREKSSALKIRRIYLFGFNSRNPKGGTVTLNEKS